MRNTLAQPYSLLAFLYAGCVLGLLTSALRLARLFSRGRALRCLADIVYVLLCGFAASAAFYFATDGTLRPYGFLCLAAGALLFDFAAGKPAAAMLKKAYGRRAWKNR